MDGAARVLPPCLWCGVFIISEVSIDRGRNAPTHHMQRTHTRRRTGVSASMSKEQQSEPSLGNGQSRTHPTDPMTLNRAPIALENAPVVLLGMY